MLKEDASFFRVIPEKDLTNKLILEHNYTNDHLEILAELFNAEAELDLAQGNKSGCLEYSRKSLILFEFVDTNQKTYSLERINKMESIRKRIETLISRIMKKLKFEYRIIAGYIVVGGLWIVFSDKVLNYFIRDPDIMTRIQTFKGWFYVLITAILFYSLLKSHLVKIRKAEQKAIDSDRLKTAFLQNMSHEIRTPMNSIVGFSQLLKDEVTSETEKTDYLEMISKSSDQLLNIVNEVLDISLIETGNISINKKRVDLNNLLEELYLSFKPSINNEYLIFSFKRTFRSIGYNPYR